MAEVVVPEAPGVLAAFGLLAAAIEHHHARTLQGRADGIDLDAVNRAWPSSTRRAARGCARRACPPRRSRSPMPPTCGTSGRRTSSRCRSTAPLERDAVARGRARLPRGARARVRLCAEPAARGVRQLPRRAPLSAARPVVRPPARERGLGRRGADRRAARLLRARRIRRHGDLRARRASRWARRCGAGHHRAGRHHHGDSARLRRPRGHLGNLRIRSVDERARRHRSRPAGSAAQPAGSHRRRDGADPPQERGVAHRQGGARRVGGALQHPGRDHRAGRRDPDPSGRAPVRGRAHRPCLPARAHAGRRRVPAQRSLRRRHAPARHHARGAGVRRRASGRAGVHDVPPPGRGRAHAGQRADGRDRAVPGRHHHPAHPALPRAASSTRISSRSSSATCGSPTCSPAT